VPTSPRWLVVQLPLVQPVSPEVRPERPVVGFGVLQWLDCLSAFRLNLAGKSAMAKTPAREQHMPQRAGARQRRRSAGIYGSIVTAAILAAAGDYLRTRVLAISVVVTLLVCWIAEEYAELLGEQVEGGRLPTWRRVGSALATTWPMVSASFAPLLALVVARVAGASGPTGTARWRRSRTRRRTRRRNGREPAQHAHLPMSHQRNGQAD
jgi:hypothetical protein